jgi:hypothetical protein
MTDEVQNTPVEPTGTSSAAGQMDPPKNGDMWKARYDGLVRKVEQLTLENRTLTEQLASKSSEQEQLRAQLGLKDTEKSAAISERDRQLQEAVQKTTSYETELNELRALRLKIEVAKEMGRPDLIKVAENIPNLTDREALKTVLSSFASFADDAVREREKQLLSGITPAMSAAQTGLNPGVPASEGDWMKFIEGKPIGSPERDKAWSDYWSFLEAKNKAK